MRSPQRHPSATRHQPSCRPTSRRELHAIRLCWSPAPMDATAAHQEPESASACLRRAARLTFPATAMVTARAVRIAVKAPVVGSMRPVPYRRMMTMTTAVPRRMTMTTTMAARHQPPAMITGKAIHQRMPLRSIPCPIRGLVRPCTTRSAGSAPHWRPAPQRLQQPERYDRHGPKETGPDRSHQSADTGAPEAKASGAFCLTTDSRAASCSW